jgi:hypothetical protein
LFQLAAGGFVDDIVAAPLSTANAYFGTVQGLANSIQQQFQNLFQSVTQNFTSQINSGLSAFQQNISSLNSFQTDACTYNQTQQYYSAGNATRK